MRLWCRNEVDRALMYERGNRHRRGLDVTVKVLRGHKRSVRCVRARGMKHSRYYVITTHSDLRSDSSIFSCSADGTLRLWDIESEANLLTVGKNVDRLLVYSCVPILM